MKFIDSHAHLDFDDFHGDFDKVLENAKNAGVEKIINIGADLDRSRASVMLAESNSNIFAAVGVHPEEINSVDFSTIHDQIMSIAKFSRRVVAIGETGLDYYRAGGNDLKGNPRKMITEEDKIAQKRLFEIHIDIAKHLSLPLVVHIRNGEDNEAVEDALDILKKSGHKKGVIHCFTFGPDEAKTFTDLGFYLGFTGIVTYKNATNIQQAAKVIALDKILIETDSPFLAPQKYRGERNEPAYVVQVAEEIARLKNVELSEVALQTTKNVLDLFYI